MAKHKSLTDNYLSLNDWRDIQRAALDYFEGINDAESIVLLRRIDEKITETLQEKTEIDRYNIEKLANDIKNKNDIAHSIRTWAEDEFPELFDDDVV